MHYGFLLYTGLLQFLNLTTIIPVYELMAALSTIHDVTCR
jgi:hypothetical protein